jgi:G:T-mismatch repair DNA endonuclease (very short patch repair protein)
MPSTWTSIGKPIGTALPQWGGDPPHKTPKPTARRPRAVKMRPPRQMDYYQIRAAVLAAIAVLSQSDRARIRMDGTLPEIMIAYALIKLNYPFQMQNNVGGGRLRLGGAVVDFKVWLGGKILVIRCQGQYWHSTKERKWKDTTQLIRLRAMGYRVVDIWEGEIYRAWSEGRFLPFVQQAILSAA